MGSVLRRILLALATCAFATAATAQAPMNPAFQGAGSPGFLPTCQGSFSLQNWLYESNNFGTANSSTPTAPWALTSAGGAIAPSFGNTTDIAPDGTATATAVNIGATANSTQASFLSQSVGATPFAKYYNWTQQLWVKVVTPPASGNLYLFIYNNGSGNKGALANNLNYVEVKIPNDGQWHLLATYIPANWTTQTTVTFGVGSDARDPAQPSATSSAVIDVWDGQFAEGYSEGGKGWPYYANTLASGTPTTNSFTLQCPPAIAFRDWSGLRPWVTNVRNQHGISQVTQQNNTAATSGGGLYQQGGLGNPFVGSPVAHQAAGTYAGKDCGFTSTTDGQINGTNHNAWPASVVFCGTGRNIYNYVEAQLGNPQLLIPGYTLAQSGQNGGTPPCASTCTPSQSGIAATSFSITAGGVVTVTLSSAVNPGPGANVIVSGLTGTPAASFNGNYMAIAPTGGGTTSLTYQGSCTSGCTSSGLSGAATVALSVPWNSYTLHGSWVPQITTGPNAGKACQVNGAYYAFCLLFSGEANANGGGVPNTFLAYSNTIDSGYCVYNQYFPANCNNGSPTAPGGPTVNQPTGVMVSANSNIQIGQLPTVVCVPVRCPAGATLYAVTPSSNQANSGFVLWQSTAGLATSWTTAGWLTQPVAATDWDAGGTRIDPFVYQNRCGFYEEFWTSYKGSEWQPPTGGTAAKKDQAIAYGVSSDVRGPVYKLNNAYWAPLGNGSGAITGPTGGIISMNSTMYNSFSTIGETNVFDDAIGNLYWTGNTDSGNATSAGVGGQMHDWCQP